MGSEKPESVVRVVESEVWDDAPESPSPEWRAEACAHSAWASGSRDGLSSSGSAPATLPPPEASSLDASPRHWDASGDVRPDWKGGWNTLTENLEDRDSERVTITSSYESRAVRIALFHF